MGSDKDVTFPEDRFRRRLRPACDPIEKSGNVIERNPSEFDHRITPPATIAADHVFEVFA